MRNLAKKIGTNPANWFIYLFFFATPIIKGSGELLLLIFSIYSFFLIKKNGIFKTLRDFNRTEVILSILISSAFLIRFISLAWSDSSKFLPSSALTNIHYLLWPLLLVAIKNSEDPLETMMRGISAASVVAFIYLLGYFLFDEKVNFNPNTFNFELGAQHSGVLAHIMCLYSGLLACSIFLKKDPTSRQSIKIIYFLFGVAIMIATAKRIQFGILIVIIISLISPILVEKPITSIRLFTITACALIVTGATYLLIPKFIIAYKEALHYFEHTEQNFTAFNSSIGARIEHYYVGIKAWIERPWLGYGVGIKPGDLSHFSNDPENFDFQKLSHFHNQYLQVLIETGILGATLATFAIIKILKIQCFDTSKSKIIRANFLILFAVYMMTGLFSIAVGQGLINAVFVMTNAVLWAQFKKESQFDAKVT